MAEREIGKLILNLVLSKEVRPYYGFDTSNVIMEEECENGRLGGW